GPGHEEETTTCRHGGCVGVRRLGQRSGPKEPDHGCHSRESSRLPSAITASPFARASGSNVAGPTVPTILRHSGPKEDAGRCRCRCAPDEPGASKRTEVLGVQWIVIICVIVTAVVVYALWPRKGDINDRDRREAKMRNRGSGDGIGG